MKSPKEIQKALDLLEKAYRSNHTRGLVGVDERLFTRGAGCALLWVLIGDEYFEAKLEAMRQEKE